MFDDDTTHVEADEESMKHHDNTSGGVSPTFSSFGTPMGRFSQPFTLDSQDSILEGKPGISATSQDMTKSFGIIMSQDTKQAMDGIHSTSVLWNSDGVTSQDTKQAMDGINSTSVLKDSDGVTSQDTKQAMDGINSTSVVKDSDGVTSQDTKQAMDGINSTSVVKDSDGVTSQDTKQAMDGINSTSVVKDSDGRSHVPGH